MEIFIAVSNWDDDCDTPIVKEVIAPNITAAVMKAVWHFCEEEVDTPKKMDRILTEVHDDELDIYISDCHSIRVLPLSKLTTID